MRLERRYRNGDAGVHARRALVLSELWLPCKRGRHRGAVAAGGGGKREGKVRA